jgi:hypothetical protein
MIGVNIMSLSKMSENYSSTFRMKRVMVGIIVLNMDMISDDTPLLQEVCYYKFWSPSENLNMTDEVTPVKRVPGYLLNWFKMLCRCAGYLC